MPMMPECPCESATPPSVAKASDELVARGMLLLDYAKPLTEQAESESIRLAP